MIEILVFAAVATCIYCVVAKGSTKNLINLHGHETLKYFLSDDNKLTQLPITRFKKIFLIKDPEYIKTLLNNIDALDNSYLCTLIDSDRSLLSIDFHQWQPLREHFNKGFTFTAMKSFVKVFDKNSKILSKNLEKHIGNGYFNLRDYFLELTLADICETSLGIDFTPIKDYTEIIKNVELLNQLSINQVFSFHSLPKALSKLTPTYLRRRIATRKIHEKLFDIKLKIVHERMKQKKVFDEDVLTLYDLAKNVNNEKVNDFHNIDIVKSLNLMINAGLLPIGNLASHAVIFLAIHQEIQERVRDEIFRVFSDKNDQVTYDKLSQLEYLDMVVKETLRLAPSVGSIIHRTSADVELDPSVVIPKDYDFIISPIGLHRWKKIWGDDVESFNPDRFLKDEIQKRHPYSFLPFSAGPRNCLGSKYAPLAVKSALVYLLRSYRFKTPYRMNDLQSITVTVNKPYQVSIERYENE